MEVCTYQSVACSTTMGGEEEDSLLFIYMRAALGNGRTDASLVVYVRRTPSELPSARDGQPADLTYIHGPWSRRNGFAGRERERRTVHMHLRTRRSFQPLISQPNTSSSSKCRKQQAFFSRIIILVSYLIFRKEI